MNKGFWRLGIITALLLILAACDYTVYEHALEYAGNEVRQEAEKINEAKMTATEEDYVQIVEQVAGQPELQSAQQPAHYADIFASGRARREYLEDLDHLYNILSANFPFFGVIYRSLGVDMHALYRETRQFIETTDDIRSDLHFANIIDTRFIQPALSAGHFNMLTDSVLQMHIEIFSNQVAGGSDQFLYFMYELDNPATRALHGLTDENFKPPTPGTDSFAFANTSNNIEARVIEPDTIAYVNILQMNHATMHLDREKLLNFFHYVSDFDHLIIDIRQNGGGDSRFFSDLVISPNISEPLGYYFYMLMMDGDHNRRLLSTWFGNWWDGITEYPVFAPIDDDLLERLTYLNPNDANILDLYWTWRGYIYPSQDEAIFGGKIWLLVSERNFSASEQAAAISRQAGFATLVGQTTGGDGIGINPLVVALPNTGVVVRYSSAYGTDPLGRNNQEFGTDPHVFNRPRRNALQTTLELIAEGDYR